MPVRPQRTDPAAPVSNAGKPGAGAAAPGHLPSADCVIKGNISSSGRIYHLPGSAAYDKTNIDESRGERWFCTEAEARAAGWRPTRGQ